MIESPYVGLVPYLEEHAAYFFGREAETRIVSQNLRGTRLTVLYGESGAGKSSLLRAGVAHQLRTMMESELKRFGNARFVPVIANSWRTDPVAYLVQETEAALRTVTGKNIPPGVSDGEAIDKQLEDCARRYGFGGDLLFVLDQFEEFFQYAQQPALQSAAAAFERQLPQLLGREDLRIRVLISMREDCLASLDRFKGTIPRLFDNLLRVKHLTGAQAEEAITRPLARFKEDNGDTNGPTALDPTDPELARWVVGEIAGAQGESTDNDRDQVKAPYLQLVMTRWWETEKSQKSPVLRRTTLRDKLGGVKRIADTHFGETIKALNPARRRLAARMFEVMVTPSGRKMALSLSELPGADTDLASTKAVIDQLYKTRILAALPPPPGSRPDDPCYEFAHDNLARAALEWRKDFERARQLRKNRIMVASAVFVVVAIAITALAFKAANADRQLAEAEAARLRAAQQILAQAGDTEAAGQTPRPRPKPSGPPPGAVAATPPPPPPPKSGYNPGLTPGAESPANVGPTPAADWPFFMTRPVTDDDLRGKSKWELDLMRNEIYARAGRTFARQDLQKYFASKSWYTPRYAPSEFPADRLLTRVQQANIEAILKYEQQNMGQ
jgi:hypothetical protein